MNKDLFLLGVCLLVLAGGGGYHFYQSAHAKPSTSAIASARDILADKAHPKTAPVHPPTPAVDADLAKKQAAAKQAQDAHAQIESTLHTMKVSSILLGDPAIVIISKQEYSVGDPLTLPGSPAKTLKVTAINDDGVTLAADGQTYHLDAPAAPDLAATRKK